MIITIFFSLDFLKCFCHKKMKWKCIMKYIVNTFSVKIKMIKVGFSIYKESLEDLKCWKYYFWVKYRYTIIKTILIS